MHGHKSLRCFAFTGLLVLYATPANPANGQCIESLGIFVGSEGRQDDGFGDYLSVDGDWLAVGAPFADGNASRTGMLYMFHRDGARWSQHSVISDPRGRESDRLGTSVSVSGLRVLTAIDGADLGELDAGAAAVFDFNGSAWEFEAVLPNPDPHASDGGLMSVLLDGDFAFVGYPDAPGAQPSEGRVHVYHFENMTWNYETSIQAPQPRGGDLFGSAMARAGDLMLIGAAGYDGNDFNSGGAFLYRLNNGQWLHEATLTASDGQFGDIAGRSIDVTPDWAVLGSPQFADGAGAVYIFKRDGNTWSEFLKIDAPEADPNGGFGQAVGVDGDLLVASAPNQSHRGSGRAFRYRLVGGEWIYEDRMRDIDTWFSNEYGDAIALNQGTLVVQATQTDFQRLGAVCIYDVDGRCGPVLSVEAECSVGQFRITVRWHRGTPGGRVVLVHSSERGFFYIPSNFPCPGTWLGLGFPGAQIVYQTSSGPNGARVLDGMGTREVCGTYLQLLDVEACLPSNVVRLDRDTSW